MALNIVVPACVLRLCYGSTSTITYLDYIVEYQHTYLSIMPVFGQSSSPHQYTASRSFTYSYSLAHDDHFRIIGSLY